MAQAIFLCSRILQETQMSSFLLQILTHQPLNRVRRNALICGTPVSTDKATNKFYSPALLSRPYSIASTAVIPPTGFLVRARMLPPSPNLQSPHCSHVVAVRSEFPSPKLLFCPLLAPSGSYRSVLSSRAPAWDGLRIASARDPYRCSTPPSRSHSVRPSLPWLPVTPSVNKKVNDPLASYRELPSQN